MSGRDIEVAQRLVQGGVYRADPQSPQWFGWALAEHLKLPVKHGGDNAREHMARIKQIIKTWIDNNVLDIEERTDERRKTKRFIVVGKTDRNSVSDASDASGDEAVAF